MASNRQWQDEITEALSQDTPEKAATVLGNVWGKYTLQLADRPDFINRFREAVLASFQRNKSQANDLWRKAKACLEMVAECSEGWSSDKNRPLPASIDFSLKHLEAWLHLDDPSAVFPWLRICYDLGNKDAVHNFSLSTLDRDEQMRGLVFQDDGERRIRAYFVRDPSSRLHLRKIAEWFLRRYDIPRALQLFWSLSTPRLAASMGKRVRIWIWIIPFFFTLAMLYTTVISPPRRIEAAVGFALLLLAALCALAVALFRDVLLPRMLGGIAIGYLFLFQGTDLWKLAVSQKAKSAGQVVMLVALVIIASWLYLYFGEVKKVVHKTRDAMHRTLLIFLIGLSQSIGTGFLASGLLAPAIAREHEWAAEMVLVGEVAGISFGIFPRALLFQIPIALFVGIVSQILWEDKPVTEPL
jgi:hypothetical protein